MVNFQQQLAEKSRPVTFKANMGLFGAVTLGVGSLMGAGLYVLVGIAAAEAGPGLWIAYAVCGLLTFLSVGMYAELSKALPISGGGYLYAYNRLGSFFGFLVGWHLAVGSIFACALYAFGFAFYLLPFLPIQNPSPLMSRAMAGGLVVLLTGLSLRGGKDGNRLQSIFTWGNLAVVVALIVIALLSFEADRFSPMLPRGIGGIGGAVSLIYISFFGYQLIANASEEIRDPEKTVPRAMYLALGIAFFFYLMVALVSVGAVPWKTLATADAPLVLVAEKGIGTAGGLLIGVGGILASVAALNGTLAAQARQLFAMGRDRIMPIQLAGLSKKSGIPTLALLAGAGLTTLVVALAELSFVAKAANFCLLFSMLPLTFALNDIYRERRRSGAVIPPFKRAVPFIAFVANTALLLTLDYESLMFGGTIVGVGGLVFFTYSYASEKRGQAGYTVHLDDKKKRFLFRGERILVPMANPDTQTPLLHIAEAFSLAQDGEIMVLNVVIAREGQNPREALQRQSQIHNAVHILDAAVSVGRKTDVSFTPVVRAAKSLAEGIVHAAEEERVKLLLMGWSQVDSATPSPLVQQVASNCRCHLAFFNLKTRLDGPESTPTYPRVGVALGGRSNTTLMVDLANAVVDRTGRIIYFSVLSEYYDQADIDFVRNGQMDAIAQHTEPILFGTEILISENPLDAIVRRTADLDLLILGSGDTRTRDAGGMGSFAAMVAENARCSVIIVRQDHKLVSLMPA